jgi:hypothetical protein
VHGRDREEAAVPALLQVSPRVLGEQKRAREEKSDESVPAVLGEVDDRGDVLEAGVRNDGVEAAKAVDGRRDCRPVALARGQVGGEGLAGTELAGLQVDRENAGALADEPLRDRPPDPARRPRDDDRTAAPLSHAHAGAR